MTRVIEIDSRCSVSACKSSVQSSVQSVKIQVRKWLAISGCLQNQPTKFPTHFQDTFGQKFQLIVTFFHQRTINRAVNFSRPSQNLQTSGI